MHKALRFILIGVLLLLLVFIRAFEDVLFYDPYLTFFENDYLHMDSPRREVVKLVLNTTLRFVLNSIISLGILYLVFRDKGILKFSVIIFSVAYILLIIPFLYFVINPKQEDYYLFFNIRRFLIQPILFILLLPAFYYHKIHR
ncbi:exosortase F system-associated protein [Winogradskyella sp. SYSU M77433]|uniref:exosortase F system-associated membrane protein n=1 Tax=Winogradskyella sp. SYSU M77433 TaxID=3042722 RepID=UPI002481338D|nr:exosortase F system-associated protein [Winogradskyella sp. SYSU M77433]MDH7911401.1 exosortase F system-associated protein [Winogradskyella sp. SYSU M77433]